MPTLDASTSGLRTRVLPASSLSMSDDKVHAPASLDFGNVILTESVTSRLAGEKRAAPVGPNQPEGLVNAASNDFTPERSSVALNSTVTIASLYLVSITSGENRP